MPAGCLRNARTAATGQGGKRRIRRGGRMVMHRILLVVYIATISLLVGSFLNVVIYRVPRRESIVRPSSHCPKCGHILHTWELIPVLSWWFLRGHCHACNARISWRYPAMELLTLGVSSA